jgi:ADP-heptose:LPS heptosyltransferase
MNRLVVLELHHLGDAVMALPFLRGAKEKYRVTVVSRPSVAELLRAVTQGIEIVSAEPSWRGLAVQMRALRLGSGDAAACVWADARAHLLMAASGAGVRAGFPMTARNYYAAEVPWRKRRLILGKILAVAGGVFRPLLTHPLSRWSVSQHHMEDWAQLAHCLGFAPQLATPWIAHTPPALPEIAAFAASQGGRKTVLVHPGGRLPAKRWPFFPDLLQHLARQDDLSVIIVRPPGEPAPDPAGPHQMLFTARDWAELLGVMNRADAVISNDSVAAHLAAALGRPVVTVFGSGNPDWFAPWGNRRLVAAPEGKTLFPFIDHGVPGSAIHLSAIPAALVESRLRTALDAG